MKKIFFALSCCFFALFISTPSMAADLCSAFYEEPKEIIIKRSSWTAVFDETTEMKGTAYCTAEDPDVNKSGNFCWCHVDSIKPSSVSTYDEWFGYEEYGSEEDCSNSCLDYCTNLIQTQGDAYTTWLNSIADYSHLFSTEPQDIVHDKPTEWTAQFNEGASIAGTAYCSEKEPKVDKPGNFCWCHVDSIKPSSVSTYDEWFGYEEYGSEENCSNSCLDYCTNLIQTQGDAYTTWLKSLKGCTTDCVEITLNNTANGGRDGTAALYKITNTTGWYSDNQCTQSVSKLQSAPTKSYNIYTGHYTAQTSGNDRKITSDKILDTSWAPASAATLFARFNECPACNPGTGCTCTRNQVSNNQCSYTTGVEPGYVLTSGAGTATPICILNNCEQGYYPPSGNVSPLNNVDMTLGAQSSSSNGTNPSWANFSYGKVYFEGRCSTTSGTQYNIGTPSTTFGNNCWCRVTSFTPTNGTNVSTSYLPWTLYINGFCSGQSNSDNCTYNCAKIQASANLDTWRYNLYHTDAACVPNQYNIKLNDHDGTGGSGHVYTIYDDNIYKDSNRTQAMTVANSNGTCSNSVSRPYKQGHTFIGYYSTEAGSGTKYIDENGCITAAGLARKTITANETWHARFIINSYRIVINAGNGIRTIALNASGWDNAGMAVQTTSNVLPYGSTINLSSITTERKTGYTGVKYAIVSGAGSISGSVFTVGEGDAIITVSAAGIETPAAPTLSGGTTKIYNYVNITLEAQPAAGSYDEGIVFYYNFGSKPSGASSYTYGNWSDSNTLTIAKNAYRDSVSYKVKVRASDSELTSGSATSGAATVSLRNRTITFDKGRCSGGVSHLNNAPADTVPLYVSYNDANLYDGMYSSTTTSMPTASKEHASFDGWYNSTSSGSQIYDVNGNLQSGVANITSTTTPVTWISTASRSIYARCICDLGYRKNGTNPDGDCAPSEFDISLNDRDGTGGSGHVYTIYDDNIYKDSSRTQAMTVASNNTCSNPVAVPSKTGYSFQGYYSAETGGTQYIDKNGCITANGLARKTITDNETWHAKYTINTYEIKINAEHGIRTLTTTLTGWTGSGGTTITKSFDYGSTIDLSKITPNYKAGYKGVSYTIKSGEGSLSNSIFTVGAGDAIIEIAATEIQTPTAVISGGVTQIFNYQDVVLSATPPASGDYDSDITISYEFGRGTSSCGSMSYATAQSTYTYTVGKAAFKGKKCYKVKVTATDRTLTATATSNPTYVTLERKTLTFDPTSGALSDPTITQLYIGYNGTSPYTTPTGSTTASVPTAEKANASFAGWYTAANGGSQIYNASGTLQKNVSGYTSSTPKWITLDSRTLYAHFTCNTGYEEDNNGVCQLSKYKIMINAGHGIQTLSGTGWSGSGTSSINKYIDYGSTVDLSGITVGRKAGYTGTQYTKTSGSGSISGSVFTVGAGDATIEIAATGIQTPAAPTISGGVIQIVNYQDVVLTAQPGSDNYDSSITYEYQFGSKPSEGSSYTYGSFGSSKTLTISKSTYVETTDYKVNIRAKDNNLTSDSATSSNSATVRVINAKVTFNKGYCSNISGTTNLYVAYNSNELYTGKYVTTTGTKPTASKTHATFAGWYTKSTGGSQIYNASGVLAQNISGYTSNTNPAKWIIMEDKTLYARCLCDTGYQASGTNPSGACTPEQYEITLNDHDGSGGSGKVYTKYDAGIYKDSGRTNAMTVASNNTCSNPVTVPTRTGYTFAGYYSTESSSTQYIDKNGCITAAGLARKTILANETWHAKYTINTYEIKINAERGIRTLTTTLTGWTGSGGTTITKSFDYGSTIDLSKITPNHKAGYTGVSYTIKSGAGSISGNTFTVGTGTAVLEVAATGIQAPTAVISGGVTQIYNYQDITLTATPPASGTYDSGITISYSFGQGTSSCGSMSYGSAQSTNTVTIGKADFLGTRCYKVQVIATDGTLTATAISNPTYVTLERVSLTFDATSGSLSSTSISPLYVGYAYQNLYISEDSATKAPVPTAEKANASFNGWYTTATGGSQIYNASGTLQKNISGYTSNESTPKWVTFEPRTLYAHFTCNTGYYEDNNGVCQLSKYKITINAGHGIKTLSGTDWSGSGTSSINKDIDYGSTVDLSGITLGYKSGYTGVKYTISSGKGSISGSVFTVGLGEATLVVDATGIQAPSAPTISGGVTQIYDYQDITLEAQPAAGSYDEGIVLEYNFGSKPSGGSSYTYGNWSDSNTLTIAKDAFRQKIYYKVKIKAVGEGSLSSSEVVSSNYTTVNVGNMKITFDQGRCSGGVSGTTPLYVSYNDANLYTGAYVTTTGTMPTASKTHATFNGWATSSSNTKLVYNASGTLQKNISGYTSNASTPLWITTKNRTLYARCVCDTGYQGSGTNPDGDCTPNQQKITLDYTSNGGTSLSGTKVLYTTYDTGVYKDYDRTLSMSGTENDVYIPTKTKWVFVGFYKNQTATGAADDKPMIDSAGFITDENDNATVNGLATGKSYTENATWYARYNECTCTKGSNVASCSATGVSANKCQYSYTCNNGYHVGSSGTTLTGTFTAPNAAVGSNTSPNCSANTITLQWTSTRGTAPANSSCTYGSTFTTKPAITGVTGYTFNKWNINNKTFNASASNTACNYTNLGVYSGTATLSASWTADTINLKWYKENGTTQVTGSQPGAGTCTYDTTINPLPTTPTKPGYTFKGWEVF